MKAKKITVICLGVLLFFFSSITVKAQIPIIGLFTSAIKKVIMAIDLKVQRLQNQTIALQNAEKQLENTLSLNKLNDISGWLGKERSLYQSYYQELAKVKTVIADYDEVKKIITQQKQLVSEYQQASALFHRDPHFSPNEIRYMENIYSGLLEESARNLDEVLLAINSFSSQMDDAERMERIHQATTGLQTNLDHLRQFNRQNARLSLARARDDQDKASVKQLYGLPQ
jgi:hypothetical protein